MASKTNKIEPVIWLLLHTVVLLVIIFFRNQFNCNYCNIAGIILLISGIIIWLIAKKTMGRIRVEIIAEKFVKNGIYSKIRHPLYLGVILAFFGLAILLKSLIGLLLIIILLLPTHINRANKEEKEMIKRFAKEYLDYQKRTKKFIPGVY